MAGAIDFLSGTTILTANSSRFTGVATVKTGAHLVLGADYGFYITPPAPPAVPDPRNNTASMIIQDGILSAAAVMDVDRPVVTRTIHGDLTLSGQSTLRLGLSDASSTAGEPGLSDRIIVNGNLLLAGVLEIGKIGNYGAGLYEIFNFTGNANGSFSAINFTEDFAGSVEIDNEFNRVLLTVGVELGDVVYWQGGDGTWNASSDNMSWTGWSEGSGPAGSSAWNGQTATFRSSVDYGVEAGTVTVSSAEGAVEFRSLSFMNDGFRIEGDALVAVIGEESNTAVLTAAGIVTDAVIAADITGAAGIRKTGEGKLTLAGNNSWSGGTAVAGGTLEIGEGTSTGRLPGNVEVLGGNTVLSFNRSNQYDYTGVISGSGQFHQSGSGTTVLTGNNTFTGQLMVNAGTLQIGDGQTQGWIVDGRTDNAGEENETFVAYTATIATDATLAFNRSDSITWGRTITGGGSIVQRGGADSVLTLSGDLSDFTGTARAESGLLNIDSPDYAGGVTVVSGGVLGGIGKIGSVTVQSGGTLSPGNSIGTLTVTGDATFEAGSIFEVEANAQGQSDQLVVMGKATLAGTVVALGEGSGFRPRTDYLILSANQLVGEFGDAMTVQEDYAFLDASLTHNAGAGTVTLRLDRNDVLFGEIGVTRNQIAAGDALESLTAAHLLYDRVFDLTQQMTTSQAQQAIASLSGEIHAATRNVLLDDGRLLRNALLAQSHEHQQGSAESAVWFRALGHQGEAEGQGSQTVKRDVVGLLLGANYGSEDSGLSLGWALGYHSNASIELEGLEEQGKTNNTHLALIGNYRSDAQWGLKLGAAQTWHEADLQRSVYFPATAISPALRETVDSDYAGETLQAFTELDYRLNIDGSTVTPFVGVSWQRLRTDGFEEADFRTPVGSTVALKGGQQTDDLVLATVGARGQLQWNGLQLSGLLAYQQALSGEDPGLKLGFVDGGNAFEIHGAPIARNAVLSDLGIGYAVSPSVTLGASYNGLLAKDATDHAIQARLIWTLE